MSKLVIIFSFFFVLSKPCFSEDKSKVKKIKTLTLSAFIQLSPDNQAAISNTEQFIESFDKQFLDSVLSPEEIWSIHKKESVKKENFKYFELFYRWYFTELPLLILSRKRTDRTNKVPFDVISEKDIDRASFLFNGNRPFTAEKLIAFANYYDYNYYEKLNLFLSALYKNISEEELVKLSEAWNIKNNIGIYVQNYKEYVDAFCSFFDNKDEVRSLLNRLKQAITSVLHELVEANKGILFYKMMQNPELNINIRNYLLQTAVHTASKKEWRKSEFYVLSFFKHPKTKFNLQDFQGWTPIFYTVDNSDNNTFPLVKLYLDHKHKLNLMILDYKKRSLPLLAAELGMPNLSEFLHKQGAPLPKKVSLSNSYITNDYRAVWFKYDFDLKLDKLADLFSVRRDIMPSFAEFQEMNTEVTTLEKERIWQNFKYYFLLEALIKRFSLEENVRAISIMSLLFDDNGDSKDRSDYLLGRIIRAIYQGDISEMNKIFSKNQAALQLLNKSLFQNQHFLKDNWDRETVLRFNLLNEMGTETLPQTDSSLLFYTGLSSLLSEAIRANQVEAVLFLVKKGANPTFNEKSFVLRNGIVTAILMGTLLHKHEKLYKDHLRIMDILMSHRLVTRDFLNSEVIPGINYADFAALMGHFYALKKMYKKGVSVSNKGLWGTNVLIKTFSFTFGLMRQTEFILKQKIKRNSDDKNLRKDLRICQKAFH